MDGVPLQVNPIQVNPTGGGAISGMGGADPNAQPVSPSPENKVGTFIQQARQQGVPDEQIFNHLHQNGMIPTNALTQEGAQLSDTGSFGGNVLHSAGSFLGGLGHALAHPLDTLGNVGKTLLGAGESFATLGQQSTPEFDALTKSLTQRYGSWEDVKKTAYQDPVGFLADVASIADVGAGALGKVGELSKVSGISKAGSYLGKAADIANPVNMISKPVEFTAKLTGAGLGKLSSTLEKSNLRLTPVQQTEYASKINEITDYIGKNIKARSPENRFEQASLNVNKFEDQIQNYLQNDAKDIVVPKEQVLSAAEGLKSSFKTDRDSLSISKQIDDFKKTIDENFPDSNKTFEGDGTNVPIGINVGDLNELKRSTFKQAFNKTGTKVSDAVEFKLGDILKTAIEDATKEVPVMGKYPIEAVNKAYGIALNAKKLLKVAMGRPQLGFVERLLADAVGFGTSGPLGAMGAHAAANYLPVTAAKAAIGKGASKLGKGVSKIKISKNLARIANPTNQINIKVKKP